MILMCTAIEAVTFGGAPSPIPTYERVTLQARHPSFNRVTVVGLPGKYHLHRAYEITVKPIIRTKVTSVKIVRDALETTETVEAK